MEAFGHLSAEECITFVNRIGGPNNDTRDTCQTVLIRAAEIIADWPNRWHALIDQARLENAATAIGLMKRYPGVQRLLMHWRRSRQPVPETACKILVEEFLSYIDGGEAINAMRSKLVAFEDKSNRRWISVKSAAKLLRVTPRILKLTIDSGHFNSTTVEMNMNYTFLDRHEVEAYQIKIEEM
ncbi:hypothetical protein, partial [Escherichia coli]|uniref:hypothetical protein n=1 Tax=Escherichia coli TaxID=562 RepID=UPI001BFDC8CB